tara:strand:+ start:594 stop:836 length:243 start_codon:yes stop_codon:yes gene_type:complete
MKFKAGDLIKLKNNMYHGDLVGMVIDTGEENHRTYGDGMEIRPYVEVQWFNYRYKGQTARFSPGLVQLEILSKAAPAVKK